MRARPHFYKRRSPLPEPFFYCNMARWMWGSAMSPPHERDCIDQIWEDMELLAEGFNFRSERAGQCYMILWWNTPSLIRNLVGRARYSDRCVCVCCEIDIILIHQYEPASLYRETSTAIVFFEFSEWNSIGHLLLIQSDRLIAGPYGNTPKCFPYSVIREDQI